MIDGDEGVQTLDLIQQRVQIWNRGTAQTEVDELGGAVDVGAALSDSGEGWSSGYNFGSMAAVRVRWNAAMDAGVDMIATDQYEDLAELLRHRGDIRQFVRLLR